MIQRKQTLFLLLALVATVLALCLPLASIEPRSMGVEAQVYTLFLQGVTGLSLPVWPLFAILILTCPLAVAAIFLFKKRKLQARLCLWCEALCALWYIYFVILVVKELRLLGIFHIAFAAFMPLAAIILYALAHRGIRHDEDLLRSADRLRP